MASPIIKVAVGNDLKDSIRQAVEGLGGFTRFVAPGDKILIKPNFNTADPYPGSSDRDFVAAFAELCREAGAGEIMVGDSCTYFLKTASVMKKWGCHLLMTGRPWLKIVNFDEGKWVKKPVPGGKYLRSVSVPELLDQIDKLFILPCLKTHALAQYTGALKLSVGLMKPIERLPMHASRLQEKVAEINAVVKPDLIVMDARKCFIAGGPMSGELREPGLVLASTSRTAIDLEGIKIIQSYENNDLAGIVPEQLPQMKRALELGIDG